MLDPKKQTPKPEKPSYNEDPDPEAYFAVLVPEVTGGFSVFFPDVPGCMTQADDLATAREMAKEALAAWLDVALDTDVDIPQPRDLAAIMADADWAREHDVDWSTATAELIPVIIEIN